RTDAQREPPGEPSAAGPAAAAATSRPAASAAAASYASASVWYTSSCMAAYRSETVLREPLPAALTIAGSDPSGGAGIQADLKAFHAFGVYGAAALTALTGQNTGRRPPLPPVPPDRVLAPLGRVGEDLRIAAAKIGLVPGPDHATALAARLRLRPLPNLVLDPVLVAGSGDPLGADGTAAALHALLPCATLVTPNLAEAAALTGRPVRH